MQSYYYYYYDSLHQLGKKLKFEMDDSSIRFGFTWHHSKKEDHLEIHMHFFYLTSLLVVTFKQRRMKKDC
jgi:hypothetical protein